MEALLTFELDFESPDFTRLSEEAQDFVKVRDTLHLKFRHWHCWPSCSIHGLIRVLVIPSCQH